MKQGGLSNDDTETSESLSISGDMDNIQLTDEVIPDPYCDQEHPVVITFNDVSAAAFKIKGGIEKTPCTLSQMSKQYDMNLYFKKDFLQFTGSFKERGARYTLLQLSQDQARTGVIAASAGNHALALACHGNLLNIPVTVVMPVSAPMMKVEACKQYGAKVIVIGKDFGEAKQYAMLLSREKHVLYVNGYDHPHVLAGQGTMGLEIIEQVPHLDACIVPVGGGGLIAGTAVALKSLKPSVQIIGVESERATGFQAALAAGKPVYSHVGQTLADGLAVPVVGVNALATARPLIDRMLTVKESNIALAILHLVEQEKAVVEGAGAVGLAAIIQGLLPELKGKTVVITLGGGNIDTTALGRVLERGLATEGRLVRFAVIVSDRPGSMAELTKIIADMGVSYGSSLLKEIREPKQIVRGEDFRKQMARLNLVRCLVETRDMEHAKKLEAELHQHYEDVKFYL